LKERDFSALSVHSVNLSKLNNESWRLSKKLVSFNLASNFERVN